MSASGGKKTGGRGARRPAEEPETSEPQGDEDGIEILEVVGVDETTGSAPSRPAVHEPAPHPPRAGAAAPDQSRDLQEALQAKDRYYDLLLRTQAEFDNFRKRTEKERDELRATAAADLLKLLFPVLDNLERALLTSEGTQHPLRQGVALIHQQLLEILRKGGVQAMETLGARFDPRLHEAVEVLDVDGFEEGMILEEMQKGYLFHGRMLRPAMVKVASGKSPKPGGSGS